MLEISITRSRLFTGSHCAAFIMLVTSQNEPLVEIIVNDSLKLLEH